MIKKEYVINIIDYMIEEINNKIKSIENKITKLECEDLRFIGTNDSIKYECLIEEEDEKLEILKFIKEKIMAL